MRTEAAHRERRLDWIERTALTASFACMVHCLALPLLFAAMPVLSRTLRIPEPFHVWMVALAAPVSALALLQGRTRHRSIVPLCIGLGGVLLLAMGALPFGGSNAETPITVAGGLMLAWAHVTNWRLRHSRRRTALPD